MHIMDKAEKMSEQHGDKTDIKSVVKKKKKQWLRNSSQCTSFCVLFFPPRLQPLNDA